jgi:amidase
MSDPTELSATELSTLLASARLSPVELMAAVLERIGRVNPGINAVVALRDSESLMAEARAADGAPRRGWLHGIPVAVKDLVAVEGMRSTSGFRGYGDRIPTADDLLARRLRDAGAILIGKTNTPEFGLGSHTFNEVYGATGNPYDPERSAGGSSGGAGAALAARLVAVADGSDMMGSLRNPAAFNNVYGLRPSWGLVPSQPDRDVFLHQLSTEGPMARSIEDLARLLGVLAGPDPRQPHALPSQPFHEHLDRDPGGLRIGWLGDWSGAYAMEPGILETCETALGEFEALGCSVEALAAPFPATELWESWIDLRSWEIAATLAALHADEAKRRLLKPEALWEIERGLSMNAMQVQRASESRTRWFLRTVELFSRYDALALPSAQVWPFPKEWRYPRHIHGRAMDTYHRWMEVVIPASLIGLPALALPAGFDPRGLPMGLQLIAPRGADRQLLRLGQAYHRATDWPARRPPPV